MEPATFDWKVTPIKIETVLHLIAEKKLILRPEYQRRSVWSKGAKSSLIETIMTKKPIPFFLVSLDKSGVLAVIDGQQRLTAIDEFYKNKFSLSSLSNTLLNNQTFSSFVHNLLEDQPADFFNYELYFVIIENATEEEIIDMYARVNKYTVNLNQQELRYAFYNKSNFLALVESIAEDEENQDFFAQTAIFTERQVDRMGDLEFISSIVASMMDKQLGNKNESIEEAYKKYEEIDPDTFTNVQESFKQTIEFIKHLFEGEVFDRYLNLNVQASSEVHIKRTRFKQKNDFLALYYVINNLKDLTHAFLEPDNLLEIQYLLILMDWLVAPEAELSIFSEYAIKCVSQANTRSSREYRSKFIAEGIGHILDSTNLDYLNVRDQDQLNVYDKILEQTNTYFSAFSLPNMPTGSKFQDIYMTLLESSNA